MSVNKIIVLHLGNGKYEVQARESDYRQEYDRFSNRMVGIFSKPYWHLVATNLPSRAMAIEVAAGHNAKREKDGWSRLDIEYVD